MHRRSLQFPPKGNSPALPRRGSEAGLMVSLARLLTQALGYAV
jgi:hypothetical protein